jgi:uncharacterized membrane protein YtjA (UPF0391 family)
MLRWAILFFVISLIAGALGFTGISATARRLSMILFTVGMLIFLLFLFLAIKAGEALF